MFFLKLIFAGLEPLMWHYGIGGFIIICALLWAWFVPIFKKTALGVAGATFVFMTAYTVGVLDERHRWEAKEQVVLDNAKKARSDAEHSIGADTPDSLRNDPFNRDR